MRGNERNRVKDSQERKEAVLTKLLPLYSRTVAGLTKEDGISVATLYKWRNDARKQGRLLPEGSTEPDGGRSQDKFKAVLETAALNDTQTAEYCRHHGLYPEQIQRWRAACAQANDRAQENAQQRDKALKAENARVKRLERELGRKDSALAETAALLTLRKKANAIWGQGEDG